ncbi:phage tail tube protein [Peptoniphilus asaccharolyticus]
MARDILDEQIINGTFGEVWIDDTYLATLKKFEVKVSMTYADVVRPGDLWKGKKLLELEGNGSVTVGKYSSIGLKFMHEKLQAGRTPVVKIMGKLADPTALGAERIMIKNVTFTEFTLFDFEHAKDLEETLSFNFRHYELYDFIEE